MAEFLFFIFLSFFSWLTVLQGALVSGSLEGPAGRRAFTLCCDDLDLQPVEAGRVQAWHHQNLSILGEAKGQAVRDVEERAEEKLRTLEACEICGEAAD